MSPIHIFSLSLHFRWTESKFARCPVLVQVIFQQRSQRVLLTLAATLLAEVLISHGHQPILEDGRAFAFLEILIDLVDKFAIQRHFRGTSSSRKTREIRHVFLTFDWLNHFLLRAVFLHFWFRSFLDFKFGMISAARQVVDVLAHLLT